MSLFTTRAVALASAAILTVSGIGLSQQERQTDDGSKGRQTDQPAQGQRIEARGAAPIGGLGSVRIVRNSDQRFDREELDRLIEEVRLDESQAILAESLFQGYRDATSDGLKSVHDFRTGAAFMDGKRNEQDQEQMQAQFRKAQEAERKWRHDRQALEESLFSDIRSLLSDEQSERRWPVYERGYRRRTQLAPRAQLPGEGIDLIALVAEMEVSDEQRASIEPMLSQYAIELDRGIVSRNEILDAITNEMDQMTLGETGEPAGGPDRMMLLNQKARDKRAVLVDTNRRYCGMLASSLGPSSGMELQERFDQKSFPRIFAPTAADRFLERALGSDSLTGDQRARLNGVKEDYEQRVGFINREWLDLELEKDKLMRTPAEQREKERKSDDEPRISMVMMSSSGDGNVMVHEPPPSDMVDRIFEVRKQKHQLVQETIDRVYDILNDAQREALPKPAVREPRRGGGVMMTTLNGPDGEPIDVDLGGVFIDLEGMLEDMDLEQLMQEGGGTLAIRAVQSTVTTGNENGEVQTQQEIQIQIGGAEEDEGHDGGGGGG